tara:strand:+ start:417 stop:635 length:219 start_codon:yes stop_codon:yes gene_type:complete
MKTIGKCIMSKKEDLIKKFEQQGYDRVQIRWVPRNPYGKKPKLNGWIYKLSGETWQKLADNYEDALKNINSI